jgi:hypothetical protein
VTVLALHFLTLTDLRQFRRKSDRGKIWRDPPLIDRPIGKFCEACDANSERSRRRYNSF